MPFSYSALFISHIYIPVMFLLLLAILLGIFLLAPFNLYLSVGKKGVLVRGIIKLSWLGITLRKVEILPQSADDLLAFFRKGEDGKEERAVDESRNKDREQDEIDKYGKSEGCERAIDGETTDTTRPLRIKSLIDAAPALAKILWDLQRSIRFKKCSCRLCFGLNDPAETAIVSGYLNFLASALGTFSTNIFIDPWFEGDRLEGEIIAGIEARLLSPVIAVIKALWVREIRLLLKEMLGWR